MRTTTSDKSYYIIIELYEELIEIEQIMYEHR